jgi:hypothetical protein
MKGRVNYEKTLYKTGFRKTGDHVLYRRNY